MTSFYVFSGIAMGWAGWAKSRGAPSASLQGPPSSRQK